MNLNFGPSNYYVNCTKGIFVLWLFSFWDSYRLCLQMCVMLLKEMCKLNVASFKRAKKERGYYTTFLIKLFPSLILGPNPPQQYALPEMAVMEVLFTMHFTMAWWKEALLERLNQDRAGLLHQQKRPCGVETDKTVGGQEEDRAGKNVTGEGRDGAEDGQISLGGSMMAKAST